VFSYFRVLKNVTISMEEDLAAWARVEAAKAGKSLSAWIAEALAAKRFGGARKGVDASGKSAMERFLAGPLYDLGGKYPTREEMNARESLRRYERAGVGEGSERPFEADDRRAMDRKAGSKRRGRPRRAKPA
jgi:hypothetical protein